MSRKGWCKDRLFCFMRWVYSMSGWNWDFPFFEKNLLFFLIVKRGLCPSIYFTWRCVLLTCTMSVMYFPFRNKFLYLCKHDSWPFCYKCFGSLAYYALRCFWWITHQDKHKNTTCSRASANVFIIFKIHNDKITNQNQFQLIFFQYTHFSLCFVLWAFYNAFVVYNKHTVWMSLHLVIQI